MFNKLKDAAAAVRAKTTELAEVAKEKADVVKGKVTEIAETPLGASLIEAGKEISHLSVEAASSAATKIGETKFAKDTKLVVSDVTKEVNVAAKSVSQKSQEVIRNVKGTAQDVAASKIAHDLGVVGNELSEVAKDTALKVAGAEVTKNALGKANEIGQEALYVANEARGKALDYAEVISEAAKDEAAILLGGDVSIDYDLAKVFTELAAIDVDNKDIRLLEELSNKNWPVISLSDKLNSTENPIDDRKTLTNNFFICSCLKIAEDTGLSEIKFRNYIKDLAADDNSSGIIEYMRDNVADLEQASQKIAMMPRL